MLERAHISGPGLLLRSWLLSEGLISSEGDLLDSSGVEGDWGSLHIPSSSSPLASSPHHDSSSSFHSSSPPNPGACLPLRKEPQLSPASSSSSSRTPVSPSKFSSPHRRKQRGHSSASLATVTLDTPPSVPRSAAYRHPYHPEPWTPESPILLLLSRFSHATDPSPALVSPGIISGLLCYLTQHPDPSGRCLRMLCRLSCNPNCLEALVRTGSVVLIHHHLCQAGGGAAGEEKQTERVKAKVKQLGRMDVAFSCSSKPAVWFSLASLTVQVWISQFNLWSSLQEPPSSTTCVSSVSPALARGFWLT